MVSIAIFLSGNEKGMKMYVYRTYIGNFSFASEENDLILLHFVSFAADNG